MNQVGRKWLDSEQNRKQSARISANMRIKGRHMTELTVQLSLQVLGNFLKHHRGGLGQRLLSVFPSRGCCCCVRHVYTREEKTKICQGGTTTMQCGFPNSGQFGSEDTSRVVRKGSGVQSNRVRWTIVIRAEEMALEVGMVHQESSICTTISEI